ncbi:uncharacterized protein LOC128883003 isoform X2 [Hylaeus volcanicus]|uniref:uncharacterized protein LOC128883003 isoform X2 n=1 Tax=Hylaeus volcanicus TaxID=313075 RepID=UPI0023B7F9B7|nr:uncharacterized protein LOC128883003 isoform X2 [Hylaeus volcanicus]
MSVVIRSLDPSKEKLLFQLNEYAALVDSLPYVDNYGVEERDEVRQLVENEMEKFQPKNYLAPLSFPSTPFIDAVMNVIALECAKDVKDPHVTDNMPYAWQRQLYCCQDPNARLTILDTTRYELVPQPECQIRDMESWRRHIDNAKAQVENSDSRQIILKVLKETSQKSWQKHVQQLQGSESALHRHVDKLKEQVEAVNKRRKLEQVTGGNTLRLLTNNYKTIFEKNVQLLSVIKTLEAQVQQIQDSLDYTR